MPRYQQDLARRPPRHEGPPLLVRRGGPAEIFYPLTGGPIAIASPNAANTFSAWTLLGTTVGPFYPSHYMISTEHIGAAVFMLLAEFSWGTVGGQHLLDAQRWNHVVSDPTADSAGFLPGSFEARPTLIPAGQNIYGRVWMSGAVATMTIDLMIAGWDAYPDFVSLPSHFVSGAGRYYPSNTSGLGAALSVTPGSWATPAWGAWSQIVAQAPNDMIVEQVIVQPTAAALAQLGFIAQLGVGGKSVEIPIATRLTGRCWPAAPMRCPVWVKAGERLAVRAQSNNTAAKFLQFRVVDLN